MMIERKVFRYLGTAPVRPFQSERHKVPKLDHPVAVYFEASQT
jgi:hypothetical protein